jgi:hypothetical protein
MAAALSGLQMAYMTQSTKRANEVESKLAKTRREE